MTHVTEDLGMSKARKHDGPVRDAKRPYVPPKVAEFTEDELRRALGPAQACASYVTYHRPYDGRDSRLV